MQQHRPNVSDTTRVPYLCRALLILKRFAREEVKVQSARGEGITKDELIELVKEAQSHPNFHIQAHERTYW